MGPGLRQEAEQVALQFSRAFLSDDWRTVHLLLDPAALPLRKRLWTVAGTPSRIKVGAFGVHGRLVAFGCGKDVAARSLVVVVDDGTNSASADFNLYLVRRRLAGLGLLLMSAPLLAKNGPPKPADGPVVHYLPGDGLVWSPRNVASGGT